MASCQSGQQHSRARRDTNAALSARRKALCRTPLSQDHRRHRHPSICQGLGACHRPSPVSPHPVTDPPLSSAHNASPPPLRSTDVLARPYAHPLPGRPKSGPLFGPLTRNAHAASPGTRALSRARTRAHKQGLFSLQGAQGRGCLSDNRLRPFFNPPTPPSLRATHKSLRMGRKCSSLFLSMIFPFKKGCVSMSVHSRPSYGIPRKKTAPSEGPVTCTHTRIHALKHWLCGFEGSTLTS